MRKTLVRWAPLAKRTMISNSWLRYNPLFYRATREVQHKTDRADIEGRRRLQRDLLARALRWARRTSYGSNSSRNFADWPVLRPSDVRSDPSRYIRRRKIAVPAATGGTTGIPIKISRSLRCVAAEQAFLDHLLDHIEPGLSFRSARVATLRADRIKDPSDRTPPFGVKTQGGKVLALSGHHICEESIGSYLDELAEFKPNILAGTTSAIEWLAFWANDRNLHLSIPLVLCSSEVLRGAVRDRIVRTFGATVVDYYGQAERVCLAHSIESSEYWFRSDYGLVELIPSGSAVSAGIRTADIVATGYWNDAMPLVRYRTGDQIQYPAGYDESDLREVALGTKPFLAVSGREDDFLLSPRGERIISVNQLPREINNVVQMQIVQQSLDQICILVLPTAGFSQSDRDSILRNARQKIPSDMGIVVETTTSLKRTASGKLPFIVRQI